MNGKLTAHAAELNWRQASAPTLADFEAMTAEAFATLPEEFRAMCGDIVVLIEDFPDEAVIADMGLESEFDILGLYSGVALTQQESLGPPRLPNTVHLYRRPILDYWAEHEETLGWIVRHVLVHEIGHHFGLSDETMHGLEDQAEAEERAG
jgi:predicted Zn-dependent protease with MMP-like domain